MINVLKNNIKKYTPPNLIEQFKEINFKRISPHALMRFDDKIDSYFEKYVPPEVFKNKEDLEFIIKKIYSKAFELGSKKLYFKDKRIGKITYTIEPFKKQDSYFKEMREKEWLISYENKFSSGSFIQYSKTNDKIINENLNEAINFYKNINDDILTIVKENSPSKILCEYYTPISKVIEKYIPKDIYTLYRDFTNFNLFIEHGLGKALFKCLENTDITKIKYIEIFNKKIEIGGEYFKSPRNIIINKNDFNNYIMELWLDFNKV